MTPSVSIPKSNPEGFPAVLVSNSLTSLLLSVPSARQEAPGWGANAAMIVAWLATSRLFYNRVVRVLWVDSATVFGVNPVLTGVSHYFR